MFKLMSSQVNVQHNHKDNARVGLALATSMSESGSNSAAWTNAYTTWQLVHSIGSEPFYRLPQLLVPSVMCPVTQGGGGSGAMDPYPLWLNNHILASSLNMMLVPLVDSSLTPFGMISIVTLQVTIEILYP
ncbi:hypothetical protein ACA910_013775 [Epithemia clementina (nom. ined.)]